MEMKLGNLHTAAPRVPFLSRHLHQRRAIGQCQLCKAELASEMPRNIRGERDATQAETQSGFAEKPLGFYDTAHIVRGPDGLLQFVGLSARQIQEDAGLLEETDINRLRNQTQEGGTPFLRQEWTAKDADSAAAIVEKIKIVAEEANHQPELQIKDSKIVSANLITKSLGGLTETDFIVAARINAINVKDFLPKPKARFWA